jgi:hypothetical protein
MSIKRLALFLRALAWLGALLVMVRPFIGWSGASGLLGGISDPAVTAVFAGPLPARILPTVLLLPPYLSIAWGLAQLARFCACLAREEHFTRVAARSLARVGWSIVAAALLLPLTRLIALSLIDGMSFAAVVHATLRLATILPITMGLIFGTIIIIFSALLDKSVQLQDENSSFV